MYPKRNSLEKTEMGCCGFFGLFATKAQKPKAYVQTGLRNNDSRDSLLVNEVYEEEVDDLEGSFNGGSFNGDVTDNECEYHIPVNRSEDILVNRAQNGWICRQVPVKETNQLIRSEDEDGNKMVNEYIREYKIGSGSYGKVVLYRSSIDGKHYAIKAFHKSHLRKQRVSPSETAMTDVLREVMIMKMLSHPNIVNLIEVIDDPSTDHFYMVLEYVDGKWLYEGDPPRLLGETTSRKYLRGIISGLKYLHAHNVVHGDIKPDNLLVTSSGTVKLCDFSVSQVFEDDNDELRRSPGTPVFTAPECCLGLTYHGRAADTWAVGVTLYYMILGNYPFLGDSLQDTYDKIVNDSLIFPDNINPQLKELIEGLLCKEPTQRMSLEDVEKHPWVIEKEGPIPEFVCWCKSKRMEREASISSSNNSDILS